MGEFKMTPEKRAVAQRFLQRLDAKRVGAPPVNETDHFIKCASCGGWIDCRRLDQVFAHEAPGHTAETVQ